MSGDKKKTKKKSRKSSKPPPTDVEGITAGVPSADAPPTVAGSFAGAADVFGLEESTDSDDDAPAPTAGAGANTEIVHEIGAATKIQAVHRGRSGREAHKKWMDDLLAKKPATGEKAERTRQLESKEEAEAETEAGAEVGAHLGEVAAGPKENADRDTPEDIGDSSVEADDSIAEHDDPGGGEVPGDAAITEGGVVDPDDPPPAAKAAAPAVPAPAAKAAAPAEPAPAAPVGGEEGDGAGDYSADYADEEDAEDDFEELSQDATAEGAAAGGKQQPPARIDPAVATYMAVRRIQSILRGGCCGNRRRAGTMRATRSAGML